MSRPITSHGRMRVVVVDDEPLARAVLREMLAAHGDIDIAAECTNGFEAIKAVAELQPDLLLLDIQMPKLDGFDVLELVGADLPVVFVTAYEVYALRAFDVHAVDYLLKPFSAARLADAIARARTRVARREPAPVRQLVAAARPDRTPLRRVLVRDRADVHVIPVARIDFIESQDDYVAIHAGGRAYLKEQTLADLGADLDPQAFVRVHRRFIVNVTRLARLEVTSTESRIACLADGTEVPVSRAGYARLRALL